MDRRNVNGIVVEPKFTRGEKCIFLHLVLTFVMFIVFIVIYAIHLYLVNHKISGIFSTKRSKLELKDESPQDLLVGYIFLNLTTTVKFICNSLLLKPRWSLSTAHCVAIRTYPGMKHLSHAWGLGYRIKTKERSSTSLFPDLQSSIFVTGIKNTIVHPYFNRDSFENNIGLMEHAVPASFCHTVLNTGALVVSPLNTKKLVIVGWNHSNKSSDDFDVNLYSYDLEMINPKCKETLAPITALRNYEFCVALKNRRRRILGYGSVVFANSKPMGLFSWGERIQKVLPLAIINVTLFQDWITSTTY